MSMFDEDVSRRGFLRLGGSVAIMAAMAGLMGSRVPFATPAMGVDAGGSGSESGSGMGPTVDGASYWRKWYDIGGFEDSGEENVNPGQGWERDSATWFWNQFLSDINLEETDFPSPETNMLSHERYYRAADEALAKARTRAHRADAKARVVAVYIRYYAMSNDPGHFSILAGSANTPFTTAFPRTGNASELTTKGGWDTIVNAPGYEGQKWRDYIYNLGKDENPENAYVIIVLAVADGEPSEFGSLKLVKKVNGTKNDTFNLVVELDRGNGTAAKGEKYGDYTFDDNGRCVIPVSSAGSGVILSTIPESYKFKVTEQKKDGWKQVSIDPSSGTIQGRKRITVTATNEEEDSGAFQVKKVVKNGSNTKEFSIGIAFTNVPAGKTAPSNRTVTLKNGKSSTVIKDIPIGTTVTVTETAASHKGYKVSYSPAQSVKITKPDTEQVEVITVTNEREFGDLTVKKVIDESKMNGLEYDANASFNVKVTLKDDSDNNVSGTYGAMKFTNGVCTFSIKGGESVKATLIPSEYKWTVSEDTDSLPDGYRSGGVKPATGTIVANGETIATVTNVAEFGDLLVKKVVDYSQMPADMVVDRDREFDIRVTLKDGDTNVSGTYGDMKFTNGVCDFKLKDKGAKRAKRIPAGWSYTVTERDVPDGYKLTGITNSSGTIKTGIVVECVATNLQQFGEFEVGKKVDYSLMGGMVTDRDRAYNVTVDLENGKGSPVSGTYGQMTFDANGKCTFNLKDGETRKATVVPAGYKYQVTENGVPSGYKVVMPTSNPDTVKTGKRDKKVITNEQRFGKFEVTKVVDYERMRGRIYDRDRTFHVRVHLFDVKGLDKFIIAGDATSFARNVLTANVRTLDQLRSRVASLGGSITMATGRHGDMTFANGVCDLYLKNGEKRTTEFLPETYGWYVEELDVPEGYELKGIENALGLVAIGKTVTATANNEQQFGDFEVTKTVDRSLIKDKELDRERAFHYTVTLRKKDGTLVNGTFEGLGDIPGMTFTNGVCEFDLKDGESRYARWVPEGWEYTVHEDEVSGYDLLDTENPNGTLRAGETIVARFINLMKPGWAKVNKVTA